MPCYQGIRVHLAEIVYEPVVLSPFTPFLTRGASGRHARPAGCPRRPYHRSLLYIAGNLRRLRRLGRRILPSGFPLIKPYLFLFSGPGTVRREKQQYRRHCRHSRYMCRSVHYGLSLCPRPTKIHELFAKANSSAPGRCILPSHAMVENRVFIFNTMHNFMKILYLAIQNVGRKSLDFFKIYLHLRYFYYLCSPLFEDKSAQPAESQCFKGKRKIFI